LSPESEDWTLLRTFGTMSAPFGFRVADSSANQTTRVVDHNETTVVVKSDAIVFDLARPKTYDSQPMNVRTYRENLSCSGRGSR
jgi:hypothetical protein